MNLGLDKKEERWKIYVLGGLIVAAAVYFLWPSSENTPSVASRRDAMPPVNSQPPSDSTPVRQRINGRVAGDFRPKLRNARPELRPDLTKIDPAIKLGLLARVQNVSMEGGTRNIFQFGTAAPVVAAPSPLPKVAPIKVNPTPVPAPPPQVQPPPEPTAPPIPFKYYGYTAVKGETRKRAFFLDGEDVIVAWEGDLIKNRYKVVRVGLRSVEMEDTAFKNARQSLPLADEVAG